MSTRLQLLVIQRPACYRMAILTSRRMIVAQDQSADRSAHSKKLLACGQIWHVYEFANFIDDARGHFFLQQMPAVIEDYQF